MKRINTLLTIGLAILATVACKQQEPVSEADLVTLDVVKSELVIPAKGGAATVELDASEKFDVKVDKDWISVSVDGKIISFTAGDNKTLISRYAKATVTSGPKSVNVTVQQLGYLSTGFEPKDITTNADAANFEFAYSYSDMMVASSKEDWITVEVTENSLKVALAENTTEATLENLSRQGSVSWALGSEEGTIKVTQMNASFMKEDSNWTVTYDGVQKYKDEDAEFITNTVADATKSGLYFINYTTKEELSESKMEVGDYLLSQVDNIKAEIDEMIAYYAAFGINLVYSDFLYEETDYEIFDIFEPGEYIAYAMGFTEDLTPTGHFAYTAFTKKSSGGDNPGGYEAWLGEWETTRGTATDTWKIVEKVKGESYTITGIEAKTFPVTATYDKNTDQITVVAAEGLGSYTSNNYGECSVGIYGGWGESSFARPREDAPYTIFTGKITSKGAELTPGIVKTDKGEYTLERVNFIATTSNSEYLTLSRDLTPLPTTLTKKGGNGGGNDGGNGSEAYNKWLGSWNIGGTNPMTIAVSENTADASFNIRGWHFDEDFFAPMVAKYSNGTITLPSDTENPIASNVDIEVEEGNCNIYYEGSIIYSDGEEYFVGGQYDAATGTIGSDGKVTFVGGKVSLQGGGEFDIIRLSLAAVPISNTKIVYGFNGEPDKFPLTGTKATTSSVKSLSLTDPSNWTRMERRTLNVKSDEVLMTPQVALPEPSRKYILKNRK